MTLHCQVVLFRNCQMVVCCYPFSPKVWLWAAGVSCSDTPQMVLPIVLRQSARFHQGASLPRLWPFPHSLQTQHIKICASDLGSGIISTVASGTAFKQVDSPSPTAHQRCYVVLQLPSLSSCLVSLSSLLIENRHKSSLRCSCASAASSTPLQS